MAVYRGLNLAVAFLLEIAALVALGHWGFHIGTSTALHWLLAIVFVAVAIALWAMFAAAAKPMFAVPGWFKISIKTLVYGAATIGLFVSGQHVLAIVFAAVVIVNATLIRVGHLDAGIGRA
jgi:hypothetical protein